MGSIYRRKDSPKWHGEFTDASGKRIQRSTGTTIKRDAAAILAKWEADANAERHGLSVAPSVQLESLLAEYTAYLGGNTSQHITLSENRIRRVLDSCGFVHPRDLDRIQAENAIRSFAAPTGKLISLRSQGHYITAIKSFSKWLTNLRGALARDPFAGIRKPNPERDRKKVRRYLTQEEWKWLSLTPNATLYATAIQTGLRANELRALTVANLRADHIALSGRHTKNGSVALTYISPELREKLAECLPFQMAESGELARILYQDLEIARALWLETDPDKKLVESQEFLCKDNAAGECLDFHSLRHTTGAWLAIAGVNAKVIQSVMRHSTITLTLDTYGHLMPGAEQDAAAKLSVLLSR